MIDKVAMLICIGLCDFLRQGTGCFLGISQGRDSLKLGRYKSWLTDILNPIKFQEREEVAPQYDQGCYGTLKGTFY